MWSGQHLEHNAQRPEAPTRTTAYSDFTIEGEKKILIRNYKEIIDEKKALASVLALTCLPLELGCASPPLWTIGGDSHKSIF